MSGQKEPQRHCEEVYVDSKETIEEEKDFEVRNRR